MMKASTQLIDDLAGVGLPSDEPGIFNFVINDHTIAVFWKPLAFYGQPMVMTQKSGRCDLRVSEYAHPRCYRGCRKRRTRIARKYSGNFLPPSPPAEEATARQDRAGKASTGDGSECNFLDNRCVRRFAGGQKIHLPNRRH